MSMVGPTDLAAIERSKTATDAERRLARCIREQWSRIASLELLLAEMRGALLEAVELEAGPDDTVRDEEAAIDHFVERARALVQPEHGRATFLRWTLLIEAAKIASLGGKPREYYVELAREALLLPAKDSAARGLAKLDLERAVAKTSIVTDQARFDERYFVARETHPSHEWVGAGDYGSANTGKMCNHCGIDPEDDRALKPCTARSDAEPQTKREVPT